MSARLYLAIALACVSVGHAADLRVTIRTDHPGGNAVVVKNEGADVVLAPDLRGNAKPWFYWNVAARASQAGRVKFTFDAPGRLAARGPAVSTDDGRSWTWLGLAAVTFGQLAKEGRPAVPDSFEYEFTAADRDVRLAVAIPYQLADLEAFLARQRSNAHLQRTLLTRTVKGRPVPLLLVGTPGPNVEPMILGSRNHSCESMACYVHEGFLEEALSDSSAAVEFRKRYALFSVPIIDLDGVEDGDQGKWRAPHDHNRDYGDMSLYPEVQAIQALAETHEIRFGLDLHCPAVRNDVHEAFYFDGVALPLMKNNVDELTGWIREERPQTTGAPLNFMKPPPPEPATSGLPMSYYFAYRPRARFGATLEVPYAQTSAPLDADMAREYGRALLRAWVRTSFVAAADDSRTSSFADLAKVRTDFGKLYRSNAAAAEKMLDAAVQGIDATSPFHAEADLQRAVLRTKQKRYIEAAELCDAALRRPTATAGQRNLAAVQRVRIACLNPDADAAEVESQLAALSNLVYLGNERRDEAYGLAVDYFAGRDDDATALRYARLQLPVAADYRRGRVLNRIASLHDELGEPEAAMTARREAVAYLQTKLDPLPVSIFGAQMASDLYDAVTALPDATPVEIRAAADLVLQHKITPQATRERVRAKLSELEGR